MIDPPGEPSSPLDQLHTELAERPLDADKLPAWLLDVQSLARLTEPHRPHFHRPLTPQESPDASTSR